MRCINCPLIKEQLNYQIPASKNIEEALGKCYCEKLDSFITEEISCEKDIPVRTKNKVQRQRPHKRAREKRSKKRLIKLYDKTKQWYPSVVNYVEERYTGDGHYVPVKKPYYTRAYKDNSYTSLKAIGNRRVRRSKVELPKKGNSYKKLYDLWNEYI
jgi:hypothetical protein